MKGALSQTQTLHSSFRFYPVREGSLIPANQLPGFQLAGTCCGGFRFPVNRYFAEQRQITDMRLCFNFPEDIPGWGSVLCNRLAFLNDWMK